MDKTAFKNGREWLEHYRDTEGGAPMAKLLNMKIAEIEDGRVTFEGEPRPDHFNPQGIVHGGYAATMLDSAMGCAAHTLIAPGTSYVTVELKLNYIRPMLGDGSKVHCEGRIVHAGRRVLTTEGEIRNADGKLIAHGTATMMVTG